MSEARSVINELLVEIFHRILAIENEGLRQQGVVLSMNEVHVLEAISLVDEPSMTNIAARLWHHGRFAFHRHQHARFEEVRHALLRTDRSPESLDFARADRPRNAGDTRRVSSTDDRRDLARHEGRRRRSFDSIAQKTLRLFQKMVK
ncbi:MAG: hypothetical protein MZU97_25905 [Bacillus subtilis]|nr:hypothetical protein [Bacillus subtilis]